MKTTNNMADDFSTYYAEQLDGHYDCVDRIVVNAYHRMGQSAGGFRTWWRQLYGSDETLDRTHIMRMAGDFGRRLKGAAKKYQIPVVYIAKALRDPSAIGQLLRACDRWVYSSALCFGLTLAEQERTQFRYSYSFFQLEYSRNLLFERGCRMEEIFQLVIERTRGKLDVKRLKTIFGFKHRPCHIQSRGKKAMQLEITIERPTYNLTVFKLRWGNLVLKMYDKGGRVLRIEAVAHNVKSLRCGTGADKWDAILERMQQMLLEFMNALQAAHVAFLDDGALENMAQPSQRGSRRLAGLDMNKVRLRSVAEALLALSTKPGGFTATHLVQQIQERHTDWKEYGHRQAIYDLAKFIAKGLVSHESRKRSYLIVPLALRTLAAYLVIRERVLKPILAGISCKHPGRPPKNIDPLDTHYLNLRSELFATLNTLGIAA